MFTAETFSLSVNNIDQIQFQLAVNKATLTLILYIFVFMHQVILHIVHVSELKHGV